MFFGLYKEKDWLKKKLLKILNNLQKYGDEYSEFIFTAHTITSVSVLYEMIVNFRSYNVLRMRQVRRIVEKLLGSDGKLLDITKHSLVKKLYAEYTALGHANIQLVRLWKTRSEKKKVGTKVDVKNR